MRESACPLGVDLGAARVRVAALAGSANGRTRLLATGAADVEGDPRDALRLALEQVATAERRCRAVIRTCDARLRALRFPRMKMRELQSAIRFEGVSMFGEGCEDAIAVRSATIGERTLVAAAHARTIHQTADMLTSCGLRVGSIDHEACALMRAAQLPLLDIGLDRSTLVMSDGGLPLVRSFPLGGAFFTDALAREFGTSIQIAETRKRTIGLAGAADDALRTYVRELDIAFDGFEGRHDGTLFVCGNGARLSSLRDAIAATLAIHVMRVDLRALIDSDLPSEVEDAGAYDWFGAIVSALPAGPLKAA